jgi:hypothetical protein
VVVLLAGCTTPEMTIPATDDADVADPDLSNAPDLSPAMCMPYDSPCTTDGDCCNGLVCVNHAYCCVERGVRVGSCFSDSDCCSGHCDTNKDCCSGSGQACAGDNDCCDGYQCLGGLNATCCKSLGSSCTHDSECCFAHCVQGSCH